jgi:hypothetical protein
MKHEKHWFHLQNKICIADISAGLMGYRFEIHLGSIDALHTQNFEILISLEQTQESKKK